MSEKKNQKFKLDLKTILTLIVLAAALLLGGFNGWNDAADKAQTGAITAPQDIADYIFEHGKLPDNFITKKEAEALGWDSSRNDVSDVAPGKSIGGDRFGNYEGLLPKASGRTWTECDIDTLDKSSRGAKRIVFSNDGLIYYTDDHYESFTLLYGEE